MVDLDVQFMQNYLHEFQDEKDVVPLLLLLQSQCSCNFGKRLQHRNN